MQCGVNIIIIPVDVLRCTRKKNERFQAHMNKCTRLSLNKCYVFFSVFGNTRAIVAHAEFLIRFFGLFFFVGFKCSNKNYSFFVSCTCVCNFKSFLMPFFVYSKFFLFVHCKNKTLWRAHESTWQMSSNLFARFFIFYLSFRGRFWYTNVYTCFHSPHENYFQLNEAENMKRATDS